ncbi:UDP-N-acetylmuramoyl-tripeptide--D-alanyl-D-alanine ligase [Polyangium jinanense]|uniref:UDP-N-acetylmuramoyl-tripeptide--D-alanyl-D-alanine ligase n=1 Tax=Polyangium jinanense TaxID=2829994 RepID=A0A9X4AUZ2_9BACT|nr:UDP-N-acetylmuramoyl-tripeptide--D-alanyl-D-alanine ligase [Polyangium jinanense]MDC3959365.1 UDP-N-acetylmuramoyl-tripeptide--D-alanyl-D-alanine ligase [Polyangium jinanense]MDC3985774.1 UDP-N-acetylmuramoyl-tripeptide--D-alanyl-D-alanine ligase [Polyangium jinanense]
MGTPIPTNHAFFQALDLIQIVQGDVLYGRSLFLLGSVQGVSTDTRTIVPGGLFVALKGESFDGHDYLAEAAEKGARAALVERPVDDVPGLTMFRVRSTIDALGALARAHVDAWRARGKGDRKIVAITGSAGKTTTRSATAALLERLFPEAVHATRGNLNNQVGVPMVLFGLDRQHKYAVVEMGMNKPGEIASLAAMAQPDVAIVTLVAAAHVEGCGSIEGVAHEKGALFRALSESGVAIGNGDDARVAAEMASSPATRRVRYGTGDGLDLRIVERRPDGFSSSRVTLARPDGSSFWFRTPLIGEAGAYACAAAVAAAEALTGEHVTSLIAEEAFSLADVGGGGGRLVPRLLARDVIVIDDSYNANPASSSASIRTAAELARDAGRRLVLVLGAMYELGHESPRGHDDVGRVAAASGAALVFAVNGDARRIADRAAEAGVPARFFETSADAAPAVALAVQPGDLVLVKGSRGVGTERIVRALAEVPS